MKNSINNFIKIENFTSDAFSFSSRLLEMKINRYFGTFVEKIAQKEAPQRG